MKKIHPLEEQIKNLPPVEEQVGPDEFHSLISKVNQIASDIPTLKAKLNLLSSSSTTNYALQQTRKDIETLKSETRQEIETVKNAISVKDYDSKFLELEERLADVTGNTHGRDSLDDRVSALEKRAGESSGPTYRHLEDV